MLMAYEPVTGGELLRNRGPRHGVQAFADVILFAFTQAGVKMGGIYNRRRQRGGSSWSLHAVGRAVDFMVPTTQVGDFLAAVIVKAATQCGVCEIIWNRRRWTAERGWQAYHGSNPHTDHVHVGFTRDLADSASTTEALHKWFGAMMFPPAA